MTREWLSVSVLPIFTLGLIACSAGGGEAEADTAETVEAETAAVVELESEAGSVADNRLLASLSTSVEVPSTTGSETQPAGEATDFIEINWDDLLPEGEMERIEQLYNATQMMSEMNHFGGPAIQIGTFNVEESLIGETIKMPGFILPLEYERGAMISEFLLVPYFGACVHTPPPPPNQIVYVTIDEPIRVERMWDPVYVTGVLSADRHMNELGDAAYTLRLLDHEPYEF
ncbi:DUF3299 domain-containing protein [Maricaulis sp. D1M11]|uniref:DUF3299 domain-containing protein n=1 Tax=Maricaulis sp. D1M11 TaxID=3076117 RepID=UPI0039B55BD9